MRNSEKIGVRAKDREKRYAEKGKKGKNMKKEV